MIAIEANKIYGEITTAAQEDRFGGDTERWAPIWERESGSDPIRKTLSNSALLTYRTIGCGGFATAKFAGEMLVDCVSDVKNLTGFERAQYLTAIGKVYSRLLANACARRSVMPESKVLSLVNRSVADGVAERAGRQAVAAGAHSLLPRIPGREPFERRAGITVFCKTIGSAPAGLISEPWLILSKTRIATAGQVAAIVDQFDDTRPLVIVCPDFSRLALLSFIRAGFNRELHALCVGSARESFLTVLSALVERIPIDKGTFVIKRPGVAVSLGLQNATIYGVNTPVIDERCGLISEFEQSEPAWKAAERYVRLYNHARNSGMIGSDEVTAAVADVTESQFRHFSPMALKGVEAALRVASKLADIVGTEVMPAAGIEAIVSNAVCSVAEVLSGAQGQSALVASVPPDLPPMRSRVRFAKGQPSQGQKTRRILDARLDGNLSAQSTVVLVAIIKLLTSPTAGQLNQPFDIDLKKGPVRFHLIAEGFVLRGPNDLIRKVPAKSDSEPAAFELDVLPSNERSITLILYQKGRHLTQVTFNQFILDSIRREQDIADPADADLNITIRKDRSIEGSSPKSKEDFFGISFGPLGAPPVEAMKNFDGDLEALYKQEDPGELVRQLKLLGHEIAGCLPSKLKARLESGKVKSLFLQHYCDLSFPFELALLTDSKGKEFFLADRILTCRWILGIENSPVAACKQINRAAVLKGRGEIAQEEFEFLQTMMSSVDPYSDSRLVRQKVFQQASYELLHFLGHCDYDDPTKVSIELEQGKIPLREIGQLADERVFGNLSPVVVFNGCGTSQIGLSLAGELSFASSFLESKVSAFVGTLWPVEERMAHEFTQSFYQHLKKGLSVAKAITESRVALSTAKDSAITAKERVWREITFRSYCVYAHPETSVQF
jgi:CHAT domain